MRHWLTGRRSLRSRAKQGGGDLCTAAQPCPGFRPPLGSLLSVALSCGRASCQRFWVQPQVMQWTISPSLMRWTKPVAAYLSSTV
ncbi:hypothetical protein ES705_29096 [subsurface metagenome]